MTIIHIALIAVILAITAVLLGATKHMAAAVHAQGVADVAALAAAENGCEQAGEVMARNSGHVLNLTRCERTGLFAQVEVASGGVFPVAATSRAGPAW